MWCSGCGDVDVYVDVVMWMWMWMWCSGCGDVDMDVDVGGVDVDVLWLDEVPFLPTTKCSRGYFVKIFRLYIYKLRIDLSRYCHVIVAYL